MKYRSTMIAFCMLITPIVFAQPMLEDTLRGAQQDGGVGDSFGTHIDADEEWLIVGAPREDVDLDNSGFIDAAGESNAGATYIYRRTKKGALIMHQKLVGLGRNTEAFGDRFGAGVTLHGSWLFIGVANDNDFPGADPAPDSGLSFSFAGKVYVYRLNEDTELWEGPVQELASDEPASLMAFGARTESNHVASYAFGKKDDPEIVLVGEMRNTENPAAPAAKLHVFKLKNGVWERVQIATSPSGGGPTSFGFGDQVVHAGNYALVAETQIDLDPPYTALKKVHVYKVTAKGISETQEIPLPVQTVDAGIRGSDCGGFNGGMSAGGNIVAIAHPCDAGTAGTIHVYEVAKKGGEPLALLQTLPNPAASAFYGAAFAGGPQSLSTDGDTILVGSSAEGSIFAVADRDVDIYKRNNGSFSLLTSVPTPEPDTDPFLPNTGYGQSVNLIGDDQFTIGQMGWYRDGGGRVFKYRLK